MHVRLDRARRKIREKVVEEDGGGGAEFAISMNRLIESNCMGHGVKLN